MKIGLALSGGGSRGIAHLGALKALNELGIKPIKISGTSAGSIAGAMISAGYSPDETFEIVQSAGVLSHLKFAFNRFGLFKMEKVEELFLKYIPHNSFEKLKIPLTTCAVDIENGEVIYFNKGELIKPILASCCLPGLFEPIKFQNKTLIDGGVLNNLPIEPLQTDCDFIIGVNVMPMSKDMPVNSVKDILIKCLSMKIRQQSDETLKKCTIGIEPKGIEKYDVLSLRNAKEIFGIGYQEALKTLGSELSKIA